MSRSKTHAPALRMSSPELALGGAKKKDFDLLVTFWGVRGSIASAGPHTARYGGNTPCVEIHCGTEHLIFDMGTGARALGERRPPLRKAHIFLSHYHYDHIQGLPFFLPMLDAEGVFELHGPTWRDTPVKTLLFGQMIQPYFPVTGSIFRAQATYSAMADGDQRQLGDVRVTAIALPHPGGCLGYRVEYKGRSIVYATDYEHGPEVDGRLERFSRNADLLIHDAMYTDDEYHGRSGPAKVGWGHSTWQESVRLANNAGVKLLALFHHAPAHDDAFLEEILRQARRLRPRTVLARESLVLSV